ncbi:MAG: sensor histidine kinase, partial [Nitrososphaerota archaeon]
VTLELPDEPIELDLDPDRISQVLTNLIANALKFSPPEAPVIVTVALADDEVVISVHDQGPGIPPEQLPHIFERFYQAPNTAAQSGSKLGLGLGLFISHEFVERHGGRLWAESTPGKGSSFAFTLPARAARRDYEAAPQPANPARTAFD